MTDKLKKYLSENQDGLNPEKPGGEVWQQICKRTRKSRGKLIFMIAAKKIAVACIIILAVAGTYLLFDSRSRNMEINKPVVKHKAVSDTQQVTSLIAKENIKWTPEMVTKNDSVVNPGLASTLKHKKPVPPRNVKGNHPQFIFVSGEQLGDHYLGSFTRLIEQEKTAISTTLVYGVTSDYFDSFIKDYRLLEADEARIEKKIMQSNGRLEALDDMIFNFQRRIDLLKRLRTEIDKVNNKNKDRQDVQTDYVRII